MSEAKTHTRRAQAELRRQILNGELAGGSRLYEVALAEKLRISRTPVREAMARLVEEGLLERGPRRGFVVRSFDYQDVLDTIELRGVIEGTAARLAAERGVSDERLQSIRSVLGDIDRCFGPGFDDVDVDGYADLNTAFHVELARLAGSTVIARELATISQLPYAAPSAFVPFERRLADYRQTLLTAQKQHKGIVEAVGAREGFRAEALAREHARHAQDNLKRMFGGEDRSTSALPGLKLAPPVNAA